MSFPAPGAAPAPGATPTPAPARRPGPSLRLSLGLLAVGLVAAAYFVVTGLLPLLAGITAPVRHGAVEFPFDAKAGEYALFVSADTIQVLSPDTVTVTGPDGAAVPVTFIGHQETITRGNDVYLAQVRFRTPRAGRYRIDVRRERVDFIVARTLSDGTRAAFGRLVGLSLSGLLVVVAIILWIVGVVRRRRPPPPTGPPPAWNVGTRPGWYPDPWQQATWRYHDGNGWTGHVG